MEKGFSSCIVKLATTTKEENKQYRSRMSDNLL